MVTESTLVTVEKKRKKVSVKKVLSTIGMILVLLIIAFPFLWLIISSFKYEKDIISFPPKIFADNYTLDNYIKVCQRSRCWTISKIQ